MKKMFKYFLIPLLVVVIGGLLTIYLDIVIRSLFNIDR